MASREAATPSECLMRTPKIPAGRAADIRAAAAGAADHAAGRPAASGRATEPRAAQAPAAAGAPGTGGGLRARAGRAAGGIWAGLARHWLITVLLLAGLVLRVLTEVAYRPVLFYIDS